MPRESTSPPTSTIRVRSQVRHPSLLMVQSIGQLVSALNLSMLSLIPDIIFNTNPTKNWLNSIDSVEILSGLDWNYELKEKKQSKNIFFSLFQITQKATKIEKSLKKKNESSLQKKKTFKTMTVKEKRRRKLHVGDVVVLIVWWETSHSSIDDDLCILVLPLLARSPLCLRCCLGVHCREAKLQIGYLVVWISDVWDWELKKRA